MHLRSMTVSLLISASTLACRSEPPPQTPSATVAPVPAAPATAAAAPAPAPAPMPAAPLPAGHPPVGNMPAAGPGHPPVAPGAPMAPSNTMVSGPAEQGVPLPLPLEGSGSIAELKTRLAKIADTSKHAALEEAFRKLFTVDRASRDGARSKALLEPLVNDADPATAALALRMFGYVALNTGFDAETARARYEAALAKDEAYGEAHYALAFVLAISDRTLGKTHFDRAMALGVPDTRGLQGQFYGPNAPAEKSPTP